MFKRDDSLYFCTSVMVIVNVRIWHNADIKIWVNWSFYSYSSIAVELLLENLWGYYINYI